MSQSSYRAQIRQTARLFWAGFISRAAFESSMFAHVQSNFADAFEVGQRQAGVTPEDRSFQEVLFLQMRTTTEQARIPILADYAASKSKKNGFPFSPIASRIELWANRWLDMQNSGKQMANTDPKLMWRIGRTEQHCLSCSTLDGKVKRASQWRDANIEPQSTRLACSGFRCDCSFSVTDAPLSRGRIPTASLSGAATIDDDPNWWRKYVIES